MKDVYIHPLHLNKHQQSFFEFVAILSHKNTDLQSLDYWSDFWGTPQGSSCMFLLYKIE